MKRSISLILATLIVFSTMFIFAACNDNKASDGNADATITTATAVTAPSGSKVVGEGETNFVFSVVDTEGKEIFFDVRTDKTTVGEALLDCGLIAGDMGAYGLYVKTVNGLTLDYEKDGKYWAFYVGDELSPVGVDMVEISVDKTYSFKAE